MAHASAFARAAEAALGVEPPPRAEALRAVMGELERIATHLADLGAALPGAMEARCLALREGVLQACAAAFGHRLMMDAVVPGGVAADLSPEGADAILGSLDRIASEYFPMARTLEGMVGRTAGVGVVGAGMLARYAPDGVAARAAGRVDAAAHRTGPYNRPDAAPDAPEGDVHARLALRLIEIRGSFAILPQWLAALPPGPVNAAVPSAGGEGLGVADGPRGDVWHWLRLDAGTVATNFVRDPAWLHWPLAEAACVGATLADVPLILASFHPSIAGLEL